MGRLAAALLEIAKTQDVQEAIETAYGTKYVIDGSVRTPSDQRIGVRTVWIIEATDPRPRFVTAYPSA